MRPDGRWLSAPHAKAVPLISSDGSISVPMRDLVGGYMSRQAAFDDQGELLVTWSLHDPEVQVWSMAEQRNVNTLREGEVGRIGRLQYVNRTLPGRIVLWESDRARQAWPLLGGEPTPLPDSPLPGLICYADLLRNRDLCSRDSEILIRSLEPDSTFSLIGSHGTRVRHLVEAPRGDRIVSTDDSNEARVWSLTEEGARLERTLRGVGKASERPQISPTGRWLGWRDASVQQVLLWDLDGPPEGLPKRPGVTEVEAGPWAGFEPGEKWLVASTARTLHFWALAGPGWPQHLPSTRYNYDKLVFTPDSNQLVGGHHLWALTPRAAPGRELSYTGFAIPPSGDCLALSNNDRVWLDCPGNEPELLLDDGLARDALAFDPSGRLLVVGTYTYEVSAEELVLQVIDLETGAIEAFPMLPRREELPLGPTGEPIEGGVMQLSFTPDGRLFSAGWGGVREWDLGDGSYEWLHRTGFTHISFSRDHRYLLVGDRGDGLNTAPVGEIVLHGLEAGTRRTIANHGDAVRSVALDPVGQIIATGSEDGAVRLGYVDAEEPHLLLSHEGAVYALAFSPDGRWLASEADDGIRIWPLPDLAKQPFHTLPHDELLSRLDSFTNWRAVPDETSSTGWKVDSGPFPGWEEVPEW